jgi:hypothetical protein
MTIRRCAVRVTDSFSGSRKPRRGATPTPSFVVEWQGEDLPVLPHAVIRLENTGVPESPAQARPGVVHSPEMVNILSETVAHPYLKVVAWVNNVAFAKDVWADLYGFDAQGALLDRELLPLRYEAPAGGGGDLFGLHGIVSREVDALAYRIYYAVGDAVFTDGVLHAAAVSRG